MSYIHELLIVVKMIPNCSQLIRIDSNDYTTTALYNATKKAKLPHWKQNKSLRPPQFEASDYIKVRHLCLFHYI